MRARKISGLFIMWKDDVEFRVDYDAHDLSHFMQQLEMYRTGRHWHNTGSGKLLTHLFSSMVIS